MGIISRMEEWVASYRLVPVFLFIFLFFQGFREFTGVRNTAFVLMCLAFAVRWAAGKAKVNLSDKTSFALVVLLVISLVSSVVGPYPGESLSAIRKNLLYQVVVFFVIVSEYQGLKGLRPVFYALFGGFALRSLAIVLRNDPHVLFNWLDHNNDPFTFLKGYAMWATFYIPLMAAYLYACKESVKIRAALVFFILLEVGLSFLNNHRTQIVAFGVGIIFILIAGRRYKLLAWGALAIFIAGFFAYQASPRSFDRYKTLLNPQTYVSNDSTGLNDRLAIWQGTVDMIKERPLLGYGYGWKKIKNVAVDAGWLDKWDKDGRTHLYFTEKGYGAANPHNLILQIVFEVGLLGLAAFLFFWFTVVWKAIKTWRVETEGARLLRYSVVGVLASYIIINATNGLWQESHGILLTAFAAAAAVLYIEAVSEASTQAHQ